MLYLGFDQSTKLTGWALFLNKTLVNYGIIDHSKENDMTARIHKMRNDITGIVFQKQPHIIGLEDTQLQGNASTYKSLCKLLGVLEDNLFGFNMKYEVIPPVTWKSFCKIKGQKRSEQKANTLKFIKDTLGIEVSEDIGDAICLTWYLVNKGEWGK